MGYRACCFSSLRAARGGGAVIRDGGVMGYTNPVAYDPSAPAGHLPMLAHREEREVRGQG